MAEITLMSYSSYQSQLKWKNSPDLLLDLISENGISINNLNMKTVKLHFIFMSLPEILGILCFGHKTAYTKF